MELILRSVKVDLESTRALASFTAFGNTTDDRVLKSIPDDTEIQKDLTSIGESVFGAVCLLPTLNSAVDACTLRRIATSGTRIGDLLKFSLGSGFHDTRKSAKRRGFRSLSVQQLLQAIIMAALATWIFYHDIFSLHLDTKPSFQALQLRSILDFGQLLSLLFETVLRTPDGTDALKKLNLSTWYSFMVTEKEHFDSFVETKVNDLKQRFYGLMQPLFKELQQEGSDLFDKWQTQSKYLERAFAKSIRMKARLMSRHQFFELYLPHPGAKLDTRLMIVDRGQAELPRAVVSGCCVLPGLLAYRTRLKDGVEEQQDEFDRIVGSQNFIIRDGNEREDAEVVSRAVVYAQASV